MPSLGHRWNGCAHSAKPTGPPDGGQWPRRDGNLRDLSSRLARDRGTIPLPAPSTALAIEKAAALRAGNSDSVRSGWGLNMFGWLRKKAPERSEQSALGHKSVSYTHLRAHETVLDLVCRL